MNGHIDRPSRNISSNNSVRVAVRIRPQNLHEKAQNANVCVNVTPGEPQVTIGRDKAFTYDHVFDQQTQQKIIYDACVKELVDGTFEGYNATVLAYGQTGSGKTYTMGTSFDDMNQLQSIATVGIIPRAAQHFFNAIAERQENARNSGKVVPSFEVSVQFIELYNEDLIDLLADDRRKMATAIKIHEDPVRHEIYLRGVASQQVNSPEDILNALKAGALNRTTAATNMNQQSSRSHAIFTVNIKQNRVVPIEEKLSDMESIAPDENDSPINETELEVLHAKFHFVDLAGSERLKRTGATGDRAKEGISINSGLLALGNVISALGGAAGRIGHVPYRDSKLTRLLQDSLGGNSRTLMIACASPSDVDFVETLNSLNYANRAKNIKNKVVANQNKSSKLITELRLRIQELEEELNEFKKGKRVVGDDGVEQINDQYQENVQLLLDNEKLRKRVKAMGENIEDLRKQIVEQKCGVEMAKIKSADDGGEGSQLQFEGIIKSYTNELEMMNIKLIELQKTNDQLQKQNNQFRTHLEQVGMATATSLNNSPFAPQSSTAITTMVLKSARKEIARQKEALLEANNVSSLQQAQEDDDDDDEEEELEDEDESEKLSLEHERLCGDLAQLQEDIDIKERLVAELESSQRRLEQMRQDYERKLGELAQRISSTESERDCILEQLAVKKPTQQQKQEIAKVREEYERKLSNLRLEHRQLEYAKKENKRMQAQQNRQQSEVNRFKQELESMKRQKVDLMKRLKDENKRIRELEIANAKKVATYEKMNRQQQNRICKLERETAQKAECLKRKTEEVQRLKMKKQQKTRRQSFYGVIKEEPKEIPATLNDQPLLSESQELQMNTTFIIDNPHRPEQILNKHSMYPNDPWGRTYEQVAEDEERNPGAPLRDQTPPNLSPTYRPQMTPRAKARRSTLNFLRATPIHTKRNWTNMERAISRLINKRTAIAKMEQGMNRHMNERARLQEEVDRLESAYSIAGSPEERATILEQLSSMKENLDYLQDEIIRTQSSIVDLDEQTTTEPLISPHHQGTSSEALLINPPTNTVNIETLVYNFSRNFGISTEAEYVLKNLLELAIEKGVEAERLQSEIKTMQAEKQEMEKVYGFDSGSNKQTSDVIVKQQDEQHNLPPIFSGFKLQPVLHRHANVPYVAPQLLSLSPSRSVKHRRRTSTTEELMFPAESEQLSLSPSEEKENTIKGKAKVDGTSQRTKHLEVIQEISCNAATDEKPASPDNQIQHSEQSASSTSIEPTSGSSHVLTFNQSKKTFQPIAQILDVQEEVKAGALLRLAHKMVGHQKGVLSLHSTESMLITGSKDRCAFVWDLESGQRMACLANHPNNVMFVHIFLNQALTSSLNIVKVWDLRTGDCVRQLSSMGLVEDGENEPVVRTEKIHPSEAIIRSAAVDPTQQCLFTVCRGGVRAWDLERLQNIGIIGESNTPLGDSLDLIAASSSLSGERNGSEELNLAIASSSRVAVYPNMKQSLFAKHWNARTNVRKNAISNAQCVQLAPVHTDFVTSMLIHDNSLFTASNDKSLMRFSLLDFKRDHVEPGVHSKSIKSMCLVPSQEKTVLATACRGGTVKLWDISSSNRMQQLDMINAHERSINCIHANSQMLFTASSDETVRMFHIR